jgi:two-component system sensor kinase
MKKILLVDDDKNLRETIKEFLTYENYEVVSATNGQEALDVLDTWTPDIILCDIMMPIMDGNQFHQVIQDAEIFSTIPFIFLSAKKEENLELKYKLQGVDMFLSKPFKINDLLQIIAAKIERFKKIKDNFPPIFTDENKILMHELNTPLNGVIAMANILMEDKKSIDVNDFAQFHTAIKISGVRLQRTLENLLLYQKDTTNNLDVNTKESSEISAVFLSAINKIFSLDEYASNSLEHRIHKAHLALNTYNLKFVLFEIIDNALKFSQNSVVTVTGKKYKNNHYELIIQDSGIGFSPSQLKNIKAGIQFNREKNEQQGLGLGLYLSKRIVKKANGIFSIVSTENEGTQITIYLPLYKNNDNTNEKSNGKPKIQK